MKGWKHTKKLRELGYVINKGDGKSAEKVFKRITKVNFNEKGKIIGEAVDGKGMGKKYFFQMLTNFKRM